MYFKSIIFLQFIVLTLGDPFHKYPYVFLLDVGNEELENTSREQIRVSVPGGSLALRYPAVGNGDTLTHVRVSGIDFGTDLKSNILDGGPGYQYVVLVFMGNPGVPYDAVITVQTLPSDRIERDDTQKVGEINDSTAGNVSSNLLQGEVDNVDRSVEDSQNVYNDNNELTIEPSSTVYNFGQNKLNDRQENSSNQGEDDKDYEEEDIEANQSGDQNNYEENGQSGVSKQVGANQNNRNSYRQFGAEQVEHQNENKYLGTQRYHEVQDKENYDDNNQYTVDQLHKTQNNFGDSRHYDIEQEQIQKQNRFDKEQDRSYFLQNDVGKAQNENSYDSELQQSDDNNPQAVQENGNNDSTDESYDGEAPTNTADNYNNYNALKALLYGYNSVLPEVSANKGNQNPDVESRQDNDEEGVLFNDEEVHNEVGSDDDNNQYERDDESAVAS